MTSIRTFADAEQAARQILAQPDSETRRRQMTDLAVLWLMLMQDADGTTTSLARRYETERAAYMEDCP